MDEQRKISELTRPVSYENGYHQACLDERCGDTQEQAAIRRTLRNVDRVDKPLFQERIKAAFTDPNEQHGLWMILNAMHD